MVSVKHASSGDKGGKNQGRTARDTCTDWGGKNPGRQRLGQRLNMKDVWMSSRSTGGMILHQGHDS